MQKVIIVTINGDISLFNDNLSELENISLQRLVDSDQFKNSLDFQDKRNFQTQFISSVKQKLGIALEPIKISSVLRIK